MFLLMLASAGTRASTDGVVVGEVVAAGEVVVLPTRGAAVVDPNTAGPVEAPDAAGVLVIDADEGAIEVARVGGFGPRPWIEPGATSAR